MFDIIVLVMSIVVNIIFMIIILKFRDLIRFGLMLRKVLRRRGYFEMTAEDLNESIVRWENFAKPFLHPEDEVVPKPDHMKDSGEKVWGDIVDELCEKCGERPGVYEVQGRLLCPECADQEAEDAGVVRK